MEEWQALSLGCDQRCLAHATCPNTFAPSYLPSAASGVGAVAAAAEERKKRKQSHLDQCHLFVPFANENTGVFGPETMEFLWEMGHRLQLVSADHNSTTYLIQKLSVAVQRGNTASVLGSARNMDRHDFFQTSSGESSLDLTYELKQRRHRRT